MKQIFICALLALVVSGCCGGENPKPPQPPIPPDPPVTEDDNYYVYRQDSVLLRFGGTINFAEYSISATGKGIYFTGDILADTTITAVESAQEMIRLVIPDFYIGQTITFSPDALVAASLVFRLVREDIEYNKNDIVSGTMEVNNTEQGITVNAELLFSDGETLIIHYIGEVAEIEMNANGGMLITPSGAMVGIDHCFVSHIGGVHTVNIYTSDITVTLTIPAELTNRSIALTLRGTPEDRAVWRFRYENGTELYVASESAPSGTDDVQSGSMELTLNPQQHTYTVAYNLNLTGGRGTIIGNYYGIELNL